MFDPGSWVSGFTVGVMACVVVLVLVAIAWDREK